MEDEGGKSEEEAELWCDVITVEGAEVLAVYTKDFYAGTPAVTRHTYGRGRAYYAGTELGPETMEKLVLEMIGDAGVCGIAAAPEGVEITRRRGRDGTYFFVMNHNRTVCEWDVPKGWSLVSEVRELNKGSNLQLKSEPSKKWHKFNSIMLQPFDCALFLEIT
ncbi:Beta-galactosidase LacA [compost metagenome]